MKIYLNGKEKLISDNNLIALLGEQNCKPAQFALAINEEFVPRTAYSDILLKEGDRIEILSPMQGG